MRRNFVTGVILLCGLVGAVDLGYHLGRGGVAISAEGAPGGEVILAGSNTQNDAFCFVYNPKTNQLLSYAQRQTGGIELKGIRDCSNDFNPLIHELPRSQAQWAVSKMKKVADQLAKDQEKEKEKEK